MKKSDQAAIKLHNYQLDSLFTFAASHFKALIRAILFVVVFLLSLMSWKALLQPFITASTTPNSFLPAPLAYFVSFLICCILLPLVCGHISKNIGQCANTYIYMARLLCIIF